VVLIREDNSSMIIHTASEGITLSKTLENDSADLYQKIAQRYETNSDIFSAYASENKKNTVQVERAYYGVITDAIEGCFAFDLDTDNYAFSTDVPDSGEYADTLKRVIEIEKKILQFYEDAAEQSKSLLADVPRTFTLIARKRRSRIDKLSSLT
jgi:hypothetical protein